MSLVRRSVLVPTVAASGCLFRGVQDSCAKCECTFAAFSLMLSPVWHLSIIIHRCASSDRLPGSMLMWVHLVLFHGMSSYGFVTLCVYDTQCMHHVGVISGVFSFFFVMW